MNRPRRERKPVIKFEVSATPTRTNWTVEDKEKLLAAIKKYGVDNSAKLAKAIKRDKSRKEIETFIATLQARHGTSKKYLHSQENKEAPIETWLQLASDLTAQDADYSDVTAQVLSVCADLEPHMPSRNSQEVNYRAIYRYMAGLLRGERALPRMNQISAAVLLDVLQSLADELGTLDLDTQRQLMEEKYRLLKQRVSINSQEHHEAARRALENDIDLSGVLTVGETAPYPHNPNSRARIYAEPNARWNTGAGKGRPRMKLPGNAATSSAPSASSIHPVADVASSSLHQSPSSTCSALGTPSCTEYSPATCAPSRGYATSTASSAPTYKPSTLGPPKGLSHMPQSVNGPLKLNLPPGIKVSPGAYRLSTEDLNKLMQELQKVPIATGLPSGNVQPMVQTGVTVGSTTAAGLQSGVPFRNAMQSGVQSINPIITPTTISLQGIQRASADGAMRGAECTVMRSEAQSGMQAAVQSVYNVQTAANSSLDGDAAMRNSAMDTPLTPSTSTNSPGEITILDKVVASQGTKRKSASPNMCLPKRTQLFSLNPLCIPVRYLNPLKKQQPSVNSQRGEHRPIVSTNL